MSFTIVCRHRRTSLMFIIMAEKDDIFIAFPKLKIGKGEKIFLTKIDGLWVGDSKDKKLVEKIGREIDAVCKQKA